MIIAQQKALETLLDEEELKPAVLNALTKLMSTAQAISTAPPAPASAAPAASSAPPAGGQRESVTEPAAQASQTAQLDRTQIESPQLAAHLTAVASPVDSDSAASEAASGSLCIVEPYVQNASIAGNRNLLIDSTAANVEVPPSAPVRSTPSALPMPEATVHIPAFTLAPAARAALCRAEPGPALRGPAAEAHPDIPRHSVDAYRASPRIAAVLANAAGYFLRRVASPNRPTVMQRT